MAIIGKDIDKARQALESGNLVGIPTETVYGLAANALDPGAVASIFTAKNRPSFDPLIVHAANLKRVQELITTLPEKALTLATTFWPGPLTLLLPKKALIPDIVTSGMPEAAFRVPDNPITLALLESLSFPLVAPSANPFGYISPTTALHVNDQLGNAVDYILDGGPCNVGLESTIVGFSTCTPVIYRAGGLTREQIEDAIGPVKLVSHSSSNPKAPGMLKSHYSPRTRIILGNIPDLSSRHSGNIGILAFSKTNAKSDSSGKIATRFLSPKGDLKEAAQNLFRYLRELDAMGLDLILAEEVPNEGLGKAINDRLRRAAAE